VTKPLNDLTDLQLLILGVLWGAGEATATEVHARLAEATGLTRKTIGTLLHRLERQAVIGFREQGREYLYRAEVTRDEVQRARMEGLVGGLFEGDMASMFAFALQRQEVDQASLERIRALLDRPLPPDRR
jgi:predicted transcriptional regulator